MISMSYLKLFTFISIILIVFIIQLLYIIKKIKEIDRLENIIFYQDNKIKTLNKLNIFNNKEYIWTKKK